MPTINDNFELIELYETHKLCKNSYTDKCKLCLNPDCDLSFFMRKE